MKNFGVQYVNKSSEVDLEYSTSENSCLEVSEIKKVLRKFQEGYTKRDLSNVEGFFEELFIKKDDICVLGTGTGELFLGIDQVKTLIKDDWEYWGDVDLEVENVHIDIKNDVACFATTGTVKHTFRDSEERYYNYLNFIKDKTKDSELTPKQKITFINWVLALTYHQRPDKERKYFWPLRFSGVLLKEKGKWKIAQAQFSIPKANFPDERFENSKEYLENYNNQNSMAEKYSNNQMNAEIKSLLQGLETELFGQKSVSKEYLSKYFAAQCVPYLIAPSNEWSIGVDEIKEFFTSSSGDVLSLDYEHAVASKQGGVTWVTLCGLLKTNLTEDKLYLRALDELENLFGADISSKEKIFAAHRSISYALKESSTGEEYTCPIRLTAVILEEMGKPVFQNIHFSFPFYWILEGKLDSI